VETQSAGNLRKGETVQEWKRSIFFHGLSEKRRAGSPRKKKKKKTIVKALLTCEASADGTLLVDRRTTVARGDNA